MKRHNAEIIRVLLVGPLPPPFGGIPRYVEDLSKAKMAHNQLRVFNTAFPARVAPLNREGRRSYNAVKENGVWTTLKMIMWVLLSFPRLYAAIIKIRPHIVHVFTCSYWGYWRNWSYILLARACGCRTIFHLLNAIDLFYEEASYRQKLWIIRSLNSADLYLLQSPKLETWVKEHGGKRARGLWNGIHLDQIPPRLRCPANWELEGRLIGVTVGGLAKSKGTYDLLDVVAKLKDKQIHMGWVFIGGGDRAQFQSLAEQKGIADRVLFTGAIPEPDKWQYLLHASVFALPSYAEGQPLSILEAMAVGLPIISTRVGSIPEVIEHEISGILIEPGNQEGLALAIDRLFRHPDERARIGREARSIVNERHDIQKMFAQLANIYSDLARTKLSPIGH
jgi:glycosyltransferase involved in cell wall biosynthesis